MMNYQSPSTGESCTPSQLIAEIMVTREIRKKEKCVPFKFWNNEPWKKKFKQQIIAANSMLKLYEPAAILAALARKECSWQYSLRANGIADVIEEEQNKIFLQRKSIEESTKVETNDTLSFRPIISGQKSKKSRLD